MIADEMSLISVWLLPCSGRRLVKRPDGSVFNAQPHDAGLFLRLGLS